MISERLGAEVVKIAGRKGQFDVVVDGETVVERGGNFLTRSFGAGYPDFEEVVRRLEQRG